MNGSRKKGLGEGDGGPAKGAVGGEGEIGVEYETAVNTSP